MSDERRSEYSYCMGMVCPECGKYFYCYNVGGWAYKREEGHLRKTFCSWSCMRKYDNRVEEKRTYTPKRSMKKCYTRLMQI